MKPTTSSRNARFSLVLVGVAALVGCGELQPGDDVGGEEQAPASALRATGTELELAAAAPAKVRPTATVATKPTAPVEATKPSVLDKAPAADLSVVSGGMTVAPSYDVAAPTTRTLEVGDGWQRVEVVGNAVDGVSGAPTAIAEDYVVIKGRGAIGKTALSEATRTQLTNKMKNVALPEAGDEELIIVPRQRIENAAELAQTTAFFSLCDDDNNKVYEKGYSFDRTYPFHVGTEGSFSGSGDFTARLKGNVTGRVKYSVKYSWCIPTLVIHRVSIAGNADVIGDAKIDASFTAAWHKEFPIAEPVLGTITLPILPVPVTFTAPIKLGIDASAKAELHMHAGYEAHGAFNIACNGGGCSGSKSASHNFTPGGAPTANFTGTLTVNPWIRGTIRAKVVEDWIAYAEAGVQANLKGTLWAQSGNGCGDADNDRVPEWVSATTFDLGIGIDIYANASFLSSSIGPWTWNVWNKHLAFWKFGDTSALDPIFYTQSIVQGSPAVNMVASMRSCWPFDDAVTYRVTWNDGTVTDHVGAAKSLLAIQHTFPSYGVKAVHVEAVSDSAGRVLGGVGDRSIYLSPLKDNVSLNTGGLAVKGF